MVSILRYWDSESGINSFDVQPSELKPLLGNFYLRWLDIEKIEALFPVNIKLFSSHLKWKSWKISTTLADQKLNQGGPKKIQTWTDYSDEEYTNFVDISALVMRGRL